MNENATRLLDRYLEEVGDRLPLPLRKDVEAELRSTILDMLDERAGQGEPDEQTLRALLLELGAPDQAAAPYLPERSLIGSRLYPVYLIFLKIFLLVQVVVHLVLFGLQAGRASLGWGILDLAGSTLLNFINSGLITFGLLTLAFALIDRFQPRWEQYLQAVKDDEPAQPWEPLDLFKGDAHERISFRRLAGETGLLLALMLVLNLYPKMVGVVMFTSGQWRFAPILAPAFASDYLPWWNVCWLATLLLNAILMRQGRWQVGTRRFADVLTVATSLLLFYMVAGPAFLLPLAQIAPVPPTPGPDPLQFALRLGLTAAAAVPLIELVVRMLKIKSIDR